MTKEELNSKNTEDLRTIARVCGLMDVEELDRESLIDKLVESDQQSNNQDNRPYERETPRYDRPNANAAASQARDILDQLKAKKLGLSLEEYREKQRQERQEKQEQARQERQERFEHHNDFRPQPARSANTQARDILDELKAKKAGMTLEEYRQSQRK